MCVEAQQTPQLIVGTWKTLDKYGCPFCRFDSLSETLALDHVLEVHRMNVKPVHPARYDAAGNFIGAN